MAVGKSLVDISFAGSVVTINGANITSFMDDQNPIEFQDTEVSNIEWSCNGRMIRSVKPSHILMSVTVIPSSTSDKSLRTMLKNNLLNGGKIDLGAANQMLTASVSLKNDGDGQRSFSFRNGTCVAGPLGPTAHGSGKMGGNTYTFAFEVCE